MHEYGGGVTDYRDGLGAARSRFAPERKRLAELRAKLTDEALERLPEALRADLRELEGVMDAAHADLDDVKAAEEAGERYERRLRDAFDLLAQLDAAHRRASRLRKLRRPLLIAFAALLPIAV